MERTPRAIIRAVEERQTMKKGEIEAL